MEGREKDYRGANEEIHLDESVKDEMRQTLARRKVVRRNRRIATAVCAAAMAAVLAVTGVWNGVLASLGWNGTMNALAAAEYPNTSNKEHLWKMEFREQQGTYSDELLEGMKLFARDSAVLVLGQETDKNLCYSPVSLYTALAMTAEMAGGETRQEILEALHYDYPQGVLSPAWPNSEYGVSHPIDSLADDMYRYLTLTYEKEIASATQIANSLWLNKDFLQKEDLRQTTADLLAEKYMVSSYVRDFSKKSTEKDMSDWVLQYTKGLLGGREGDFDLNENTAMTLLSTVYYFEEWTDRFDKSRNVIEPFYKADGTTVEAEYMCVTHNPYSVLAREGFTASGLSTKGSGQITFILPDEGYTPEDILANDEMMAEILAIGGEPEMDYAEVRFKVPKFQFWSEMDLTDTVKQLGITAAFSQAEADFSGILNQDVSGGEDGGVANGQPAPGGSGIWLSSIRQQTTMSVDERGVEAAAYIELQYAGAAMPEDRIIEFTLNRPFIILIENGGPLFIGVVNVP